MVTIAIEGCAHGELDNIYASILETQRRNPKLPKIELLICCGDFQAVRNESDLDCMNVPPKYREMNDFYKYYSGEKVAPVLTIFVGGNHEASNHLRELYYGGWVAPNIYFMGYSSVINFRGLRIAGMSGIYNHRNYRRPYDEKLPYSKNDIRSVYHTRELEVMKLCQIKEKVDIFLSHDWPQGIETYGDTEHLLRRKRHFERDIRTGNLGSVAGKEVLKKLRPDFWFSSHMHVKFSALVRWNQFECRRCDEGRSKAGDRIPGATKFLSLDKCLPRRHFLQIMTIQPRDEMKHIKSSDLMYDQEWLDIVKRSHHLIEIKGRSNSTTTNSCSISDYSIPKNFVQTVGLDESEVKLRGNPQTDTFLKRMGLRHGVLTVPFDDGKGDDNDDNAVAGKIVVDAESGGENSDDDNEIDLDDF